MAYANTAHQARQQRSFWDFVSELASKYEMFRAYRTTLRELNELTNRELADLGMHRSELTRIAHEAIYDKA